MNSAGSPSRRLVTWNRRAARPLYLDPNRIAVGACAAGSECAWRSGFIANRTALLREVGLSPETGDEALLLALHATLGPEAAAQRITGPFAWIVWDDRTGTLTAARDRIGTRELYFAERDDLFWLAGDIGALLDAVPGPHRFDLRSVVALMHARPPRDHHTYYEGIHALEPGSVLAVSPDRAARRRYWSIEPRPALTLASDAEYAEAFRILLFEVAREYLAGGPMGVTLSSGLDSTSVAAAITAVAPAADLTAVTYVSPDLPAADEQRLASQVATRLGLPHLTVRGDLLWTLSAPGGLHTDRASPFLLYFEELNDAMHGALAHRGIHVVFDGQSGDDLFGGNVFAYPDLLLTGRWGRLAREFRYHVPRSPARLSMAQAVRTLVVAPLVQAYAPALLSRRARPKPWLRTEHLPLFREIMAPPRLPRDMLPGRILRFKALDNSTMTRVASHTDRRAWERQGVELRHPLLDHRLVEFALGLPTTQTFRAGQRKIVVRNAMRGRLPDEVVDMWGKTVPTTISERGLREREQARVWALLTNMRSAEFGLVDEARARRTYQQFIDREDDQEHFWYTLTIEDWLRRYF